MHCKCASIDFAQWKNDSRICGKTFSSCPVVVVWHSTCTFSAGLLILQRNIRAWCNLRNWHWFRLYSRVKPLIKGNKKVTVSTEKFLFFIAVILNIFFRMKSLRNWRKNIKNFWRTSVERRNLGKKRLALWNGWTLSVKHYCYNWNRKGMSLQKAKNVQLKFLLRKPTLKDRLPVVIKS